MGWAEYVNPWPKIPSSFAWLSISEVIFSLTNFLGINVGSKKLVLSSGYHEFLLEDLFSIPNKGSYIIGVQGLDSRLSEIIIVR